MKEEKGKASEGNCKTVNIMINHKTPTGVRRKGRTQCRRTMTMWHPSGSRAEKDGWSTTEGLSWREGGIAGNRSERPQVHKSNK